MVAPECDGEDVSEPWVAYQWASRLAAGHELTVLTCRRRGHKPLSGQLPVRVIEWGEPPLFNRAERFNSMLMPGYVPFYMGARRWTRSALARGERFDICYQPVPVAMRYPSPVAGLGVPLAIGPLGGSLPSPVAFRREESATPWYVRMRALDQLRLRRDPLLRHTYQTAACVLGIAPYVRDLLASMPLRRFEVMSETGIERLPPEACRTTGHGLRLLFVGRIVRTKGARDAIRALALARDLPAVIDIVGDGPDRRQCESLARRAGLGSRVRFHGWLPRAAVDKFYRLADVFIFPSYREPGGNVIFEAMSHGLPLIVSDIGGPGSIVNSGTGIRIHPFSPGQYAQDLSGAIRILAVDYRMREGLGRAARSRVAELGLWEAKVRHLERILTEVAA
jgi:glycosyltransferase involved in cell wall biosynthesis